jgi:hypothetical protein
VRLGVYIQSNRRQHIGALVSAYSIKRGTKSPSQFSITILSVEDAQYAAILKAAEGRTFDREGRTFTWRNDVLQSFPPLRFAPPEIQNYEGRALVIDPDVFAFGDVLELLTCNMEGKAILCRGRTDADPHLSSSVMLLDCTKLRHWKFAEMFERLLNKQMEWTSWMRLRGEPADTIGHFSSIWNDFDNLTPDTQLLHNTKQRTQPWRTGLPIEPKARDEQTNRLRYLKRRLFGPREYHSRHPDPVQELAFFALLREGMETGAVPRDQVARAARARDIRRDAMRMAERAPRLPEDSSCIVACLREYVAGRAASAAE